jgi:hypothetical protein
MWARPYPVLPLHPYLYTPWLTMPKEFFFQTGFNIFYICSFEIMGILYIVIGAGIGASSTFPSGAGSQNCSGSPTLLIVFSH